MFLLEDPDEDHQLKEMQLIAHTLIKLQGTGFYSNAIKLWHRHYVLDRQCWAEF